MVIIYGRVVFISWCKLSFSIYALPADCRIAPTFQDENIPNFS